MNRDKNFLLGQGERLTSNVKVPSRGGEKKPPYTFIKAKERIEKNLNALNKELSQIPQDACPYNQVVALVTMHPRYVSKSDFPEDLFKSVGVRSIGSRSTSIKPDKWGTRKHPAGKVVTEQVFVAGKKEAFDQWATNVTGWSENRRTFTQITKIEKVSPFVAREKIKSIPNDKDEATLEVVLHNASDPLIVDAFEAYALKKDSKPIMDRRKDIGGLSFIPVKAPTNKAIELAQFSFLRVLRGMPELRPIIGDVTRSTKTIDVLLPQEAAINSDINVVVFDGGVPANTNLDKWVTSIDPPHIGKPYGKYIQHGIGVTSALLFGHIDDKIISRPFCNIDHVRVLDENNLSKSNDLEILDVLDRILWHLDKYPKKYHFVNISLGPNLPIADDEVTVWTASLDERLSKGDILTTVAVGNDGNLDAISGLNRVQPPSDGVNVLAVGACDRPDKSWKRADYSCLGPGRRPGIVKPDGLAFGGSDKFPFMVLAPSSKPTARAVGGTSFAAPLALRTATGIRSYIGESISPRTIRALMIHKADALKHPKVEVGWGRFETDINELITCQDHEVLVVYQGELPVGEHLRAFIPMPNGTLQGMITVSATLVISPEIDPEHPGAYTRSGLEIAFRPHIDMYSESKGKRSKHPKTKSFFSTKNMYGKAEYEFREDGYKWEPCLKNSKQFRCKSLKKPCFDIYYHNREGASKAESPIPIPYSLVVGIQAPKINDFYNLVVRTYSHILVPLRPRVQIQVRQ
jgi:hypothetical protein